MNTKEQNTVTLCQPIEGPGDAKFSTVEVLRPTVGSLRGLQLAMVQLQDVNAMVKLLPRVTKPALSPDQVEELDPVDFAALANRVSLFFMTPSQLASVQTMN